MAVAERRVRNRRRKDARPEEILRAALSEFLERGYAAARLDEVAARAGIAKGTIYLYYPSKEELFRAVVRQAVIPHFARFAAAADGLPTSVAAFLRGPFRELARQLVTSEGRYLIRLFMAEGERFPELTAFYYDEAIAPGLETLRRVLRGGIATGEIRPTPLVDHPHGLVAAPVLALVWESLLREHAPLDLDRVLDAHLDAILEGLRPRA